MINNNKGFVQVLVILTVVVVLGAGGYYLATKNKNVNVEIPSESQNVQAPVVASPGEIKQPQKSETQISSKVCTLNKPETIAHIAYPRGERLIYDGKDMGAEKWFSGFLNNVSLSGDSIAFTRFGNPESNNPSDWHVIYNGKDLGVGSSPVIDGKHLAFGKYDAVQKDINLYHDGKISSGKDMASPVVLSGDHIAYVGYIDDKRHIIYDGKDLGEGTEVEISGDNIAYVGEVIMTPPFENNIYLNGKKIGEGIGGIILSGKNIAFTKNVNNERHIVFNGKDYGEYVTAGVYADGETPFIDGAHIVFVRDIDGKRHIIYDGEDLGEGSFPSLSGNHLAYQHDGSIVYDRKIIAKGSKPIVVGNHLAFSSVIDRKSYMVLDCQQVGLADQEHNYKPIVSIKNSR